MSDRLAEGAPAEPGPSEDATKDQAPAAGPLPTRPPSEGPPPTRPPQDSILLSSAVGHDRPESHDKKYLAKMTLAALGVVYGDIGTSPLYAIRECFRGSHVPIDEGSVLGVLSLIFWSLMLIVTLKYVFYVLRADNKGEGGILALMALNISSLRGSRLRPLVIACGVFGAGLLYGDGAITPAISVLSAVEGLQVAAPSLSVVVLPLTVAILIGLFWVQKRGTAGLGNVFGPITLTWFFVIGLLGVIQMLRNPHVFLALSPAYAFDFFLAHGEVAVPVMGAACLVVTGGEALYADLGHFGKKPIRLAWFFVVLPALLLNYFGQGALLLSHPQHVENPFFQMAPSWALYPLVALSTAATVIASQALITGVFSITQQATMLGLLPRMNVQHTSAVERGQIYVPIMNWMLMVATISLVIGFKSSSNMAAAYGVAVTLTMILTTVLVALLARRAWKFRWRHIALAMLPFALLELAYLLANLAKIPHGGWFPLALGISLFVVMMTWRRGRTILAQRFKENALPLSDFFDLIRVELPARVPGTAVFMSSMKDGTPPALLHNFMHNRVLHQHIVLVTMVTQDSARVTEDDRFVIEHLDHGFARVTGRYGFMEQPDAPLLLERAGLVSSVEHTTFFLGRENLIATAHPGMARWRVRLFAWLTRNAQPANKFFNIPPDRVMEIGAQIEL
jgi:KUP system potassium uptake protein